MAWSEINKSVKACSIGRISNKFLAQISDLPVNLTIGTRQTQVLLPVRNQDLNNSLLAEYHVS